MQAKREEWHSLEGASMSAYTELVQSEAVDAFPDYGTRLRLYYPRQGGCVALIGASVTREPLALGVGSNHREACIHMLRQMQAKDYALDAGDATKMLGWARSGIRELQFRGGIKPAAAGAMNHPEQKVQIGATKRWPTQESPPRGGLLPYTYVPAVWWWGQGSNLCRASARRFYSSRLAMHRASVGPQRA